MKLDVIVDSVFVGMKECIKNAIQEYAEEFPYTCKLNDYMETFQLAEVPDHAFDLILEEFLTYLTHHTITK